MRVSRYESTRKNNRKSKQGEGIKEWQMLMAPRLAAGKEQSTFTSIFSRHPGWENEGQAKIKDRLHVEMESKE